MRRTTSAQTGADLQVQFEEPVSQQRAMEEVTLAIQRAGESRRLNELCDFSGDIFTNQKGKALSLRTWILFDGHENTLNGMSRPSQRMILMVSAQWSSFGFTAGSSARSQLDISRNDMVKHNHRVYIIQFWWFRRHEPNHHYYCYWGRNYHHGWAQLGSGTTIL